MDVLSALVEYFKKNDIEYAIIGAYALFSYGIVRATKDIDLITRLSNQKKVIANFESLGFETTYRSKAFSNHCHPIGNIRVDMMYIEGHTADVIFSSASGRQVINKNKYSVISVEYLIALKLFALSNNPERKLKDLNDIKEMLLKCTYNKKLVEGFFKKYNQLDFYHAVTGEEHGD